MNYDEALDYIYHTAKLGSKLGLQNITELLKRWEIPIQPFLLFMLPVPTEGSVTAMTASMHKAGYRVGMFVSPYLENFTERFK